MDEDEARARGRPVLPRVEGERHVGVARDADELLAEAQGGGEAHHAGGKKKKADSDDKADEKASDAG